MIALSHSARGERIGGAIYDFVELSERLAQIPIDERSLVWKPLGATMKQIRQPMATGDLD